MSSELKASGLVRRPSKQKETIAFDRYSCPQAFTVYRSSRFLFSTAFEQFLFEIFKNSASFFIFQVSTDFMAKLEQCLPQFFIG